MVRPVLAALLAALAADPSSSLQAEKASVRSERVGPRLVVLVSIDQMIPEQLERLAPHFTGGLARFVREGRVHRRARLGYARSETGPGHASLGTGCWPWRHGVVANDFRDAARGTWTYCAGDDDARAVTRLGRLEDSDEYRISPRNLLVDGAAAWFERTWPGARTIAIAGKDRAAVLTPGRGADVAVWWDRYRCGFASSDHYGDELPAWAAEWNSGWREATEGWVWEPLVPLATLAAAGTAEDEREGESPCSSNGVAFPHPAPELSADPTAREVAALGKYCYGSPQSDRFVLELALRAVVAEDLGGDDAVDLLFVGLSACDTVGHATGPYGAETTDVILRADRGLGELFALLDERLGEEGWIACLSADHGVLELPEARRARTEPSGRVTQEDLDRAREGLRAALEERFGDHFRASVGGGGVYFDAERLAQVELDPAEVRAFARDHLVARVAEIAGGFTADELAADEPVGSNAYFELARRSAYATRGPDVALRLTPWTILSWGTGTTHGSTYEYDRRVPLVFLGEPFIAGDRWEPADPVDALPTLLHVLDVPFEPERFDGRALVHGLR